MKSLTLNSGENVIEGCAELSINVPAGINATAILECNGENKIDVMVESGAKLIMYNLHKNSVCKSVGHVKKDAKLVLVDVVLEQSDLDVSTILEESGGESIAMQAFLGTATIKSDVIHQAGSTTSKMLAKGLLHDAIGKYTGTITIGAGAAGCVAHQRSDMLLLDEKSKSDAEPILDVNNDDVICSHGATLGQIDESQIFYLTSRGLSENVAKQMIMEGFLGPIFEHIPNEILKAELIEHIRTEIVRIDEGKEVSAGKQVAQSEKIEGSVDKELGQSEAKQVSEAPLLQLNGHVQAGEEQK
jgi:hypothetical protein